MSKAMPLYQIIKNDIKASIRNGMYQANDKIPSESELGKKYKTSRITIVRAINDLVSEGLLRREHGKGSFVNNAIKENIMQLTSFHERMVNLNYKLETRILEKRQCCIPKEMATYFALPKDTIVYFIKRLRIVNDKRLCISLAYFILEKNSWLLEENFEQRSIYDYLENDKHMKLGEAIQRISIGYLNPTDAEKLLMTENDPLLKLTLFTKLDTQVPFEYDVTYYNPNLYEYEMIMSR